MPGVRPHVSDALRHLHKMVVLCSFALGACIVLQMLVWAFVHFTDVRWDTVEQVVTEQHTPAIVQSGGGETGSAMSRTGRDVSARASLVESVQVNRIPSRNDGWFRNIVSLTSAVGFICAMILFLSMRQAVTIAGGGRVPGVEKAVTASTWAIVVTMLCIPVGEMLPALPVRGIFGSYESMTSASEAVKAGLHNAPSSLAFYGEHVIFPVLILAALTLTVAHFNAGIEQGMIATSVNDLDDKLAKEMSSIKKISTGAPRSIGALNRAIGGDSDEAEEEDAQAEPAPSRGMKAPAGGEPLQRPI